MMPVPSPPPVHFFWKPHCFSFSTKNILYFISQFAFLRIDISAGSGVRDANMIEWCEGSSSRPTNMVSSSSSPSYNQKPSPTIMVSSSSPSYNKKPSTTNIISSSSPSFNQKPSQPLWFPSTCPLTTKNHPQHTRTIFLPPRNDRLKVCVRIYIYSQLRTALSLVSLNVHFTNVY